MNMYMAEHAAKQYFIEARTQQTDPRANPTISAQRNDEPVGRT